MTDEKKLEGKKEEEKAIEVKSETVNEGKKAEAKEKTEYKRTDYEYKSWSGGVPVPEGWERCPGYADVIRRLKVAPPKPKEPAVETKSTEAVGDSSPKGDERGQWGCCH